MTHAHFPDLIHVVVDRFFNHNESTERRHFVHVGPEAGKVCVGVALNVVSRRPVVLATVAYATSVLSTEDARTNVPLAFGRGALVWVKHSDVLRRFHVRFPVNAAARIRGSEEPSRGELFAAQREENGPLLLGGNARARHDNRRIRASSSALAHAEFLATAQCTGAVVTAQSLLAGAPVWRVTASTLPHEGLRHAASRRARDETEHSEMNNTLH